MSTDTVPETVDSQHVVTLAGDFNRHVPIEVYLHIHGAPGKEIASLRFDRPWAAFSQAMSLPDLMALHGAIGRAIEDVTG